MAMNFANVVSLSVVVGFFNVPKFFQRGMTALLPLRTKLFYGYLSP
jgi:hypothetical protein